MLTFRTDVYSWIPQADIVNPIALLPGGVARWGAGACGPRFGGDGFTQPASSYSGWKGKTFRATQSLAFNITSFGAKPNVSVDSGVTPGLTTVLTGPRSAGGRVCTSLTPTITKSTSDVSWSASDRWYEMRMHGSAHDPIPEAALKFFAGDVGLRAGGLMTPDLEWRLVIRVQEGTTQSLLTRLRYGVASTLSLDTSQRIPAPQNFGGTSNLIHGLVYVRKFPSYVVYMSITGETISPISLPVYFSDATERHWTAILLGQEDPIRQVSW